MHHGRARRTLPAGGALLVGCVAFLSGCHTASPLGSVLARHGAAATPPDAEKAPDKVAAGKAAPKPAPRVTVAPGMELEWRLRASQDRPDLVRNGKAVVGPDGALVLGPYGACKVAGLTLDQASGRLEKHLATYVKHPIVSLSLPLTDTVAEVAWRPARAGTAVGTPALALSPVPKAGPLPTVVVADSAPPPPAKDRLTAIPLLPLEKDAPPPAAGLPPTMVAMGPPLGILGPPPGPFVPLPPAPNEGKRMLLPSYVIGPPDVLQIDLLPTKGLEYQPVRGPHLVRPDGTIGLGVYGSVLVAGQTIEQAKDSITRKILTRLKEDYPYKNVFDYLSVDVVAYNSKVYYVITDGAGAGAQITSWPITGNETVLDAFVKVNGLSPVSDKKRIWVARRTPGLGTEPKKLPVDYCAVVLRGEMATNWQLMPGDRVYIHSEPVRRVDTWLAKVISPIERVFGVTLLGSQTVNSLRSGSTGGNGTGFPQVGR